MTAASPAASPDPTGLAPRPRVPTDRPAYRRARFVGRASSPVRRSVSVAMAPAALRSRRSFDATWSNWPRWYGRCGLSAVALGRPLFIDDGEFQCVAIDLATKMH